MGVELVSTPKAPKKRSLAIRLTAKVYHLHMLLFGRSACALKTLDMESSLYFEQAQWVEPRLITCRSFAP